jgi:diadenosine tetraphosphate (Ap4A) HIT family hydrolase
MSAVDDCAICAMVDAEPAAGWAYQDETWVAGILAGLEVPGWIVLALRRHAEETAPLSELEAANLGPAIRRLSAAVEDVTDAERVYLQAYGEKERHWHLLISARGTEIPPEHRHVSLFAHRQEYVDVAAAHQVLDRLRTALATATGTDAQAVT